MDTRELIPSCSLSTEERLCDILRQSEKVAVCRTGGRPETELAGTLPQTSDLQNYEKHNFSCLTSSAYVILLWQVGSLVQYIKAQY